MKPTLSACPITKTAQILSDVWTMLIVHELLDAPKRFCELERALTGISTRTLSSKLEILTETGLLCKIDEHYTLTEKGKGLRGIERAMRAYGTKYLA